MAMSGGGISWHGPGPGGQHLVAPTHTTLRKKPRRSMRTTENDRQNVVSPRTKLNHKLWKPLGWCWRAGGVNLIKGPPRSWALWVALVLLLWPSQTEGLECWGLSAQPGCHCTQIANKQTFQVNCASSVQDLEILLAALTPSAIGELILRGTSISNIPTNAFQDYQNLLVLDLSDNKLSTLEQNVFQPLTNLEVLKLAGNSFKTLPSGVFAGRSTLRELSLAGNFITNIDANLCEDLVALELLDLSGNQLTTIPFKLFNSIKSDKDLKQNTGFKGNNKRPITNERPSSKDSDSQTAVTPEGFVQKHSPSGAGEDHSYELSSSTSLGQSKNRNQRRGNSEPPPGHRITTDSSNIKGRDNSEDGGRDFSNENDSKEQGGTSRDKNSSLGQRQTTEDTSVKREDSRESQRGSQRDSKERPDRGSKRTDSEGDDEEDDSSERSSKRDSRERSDKGSQRTDSKGDDDDEDDGSDSNDVVGNQFLPLSSLDLSGNIWKCSCLTGGLIAWYKDLHRRGIAKNAENTLCKSPSNLANQKWIDLDLSTLDCDKSAFVSCTLDGVSSSVVFQASYPDKVAARQECDKACAQQGKTLGLFQMNFICYCGESLVNCSCPDEEPLNGNTLCEKTYMNGAFKSSVGLLLGPVSSTSTFDNAVFSVSAHPTTEWNFGDGSGFLVGETVSHNYMFPGQYSVTAIVPNFGSSTFPVYAWDPIVTSMSAPAYSDAEKDVDVCLNLHFGAADVTWRRLSNGQEVLGKRCPDGWYGHGVHSCVRATYHSTSERMDFAMAEQACTDDKNAKLLPLSSDREQKRITNIFSDELDMGKTYLLGAYKAADNVSYVWKQNNKLAFFNVSMVDQGNRTDCVALGTDGLLGIDCDNIPGYICKAAQVICKYGGKDWNQGQCLLPLGSDSPLSWYEAEDKCQTMRGHLAKIDSADKDDFIRETVLDSYEDLNLWMGLSDQYVPKFYQWVDGESLDSAGYAPWENDPDPSAKGRCVRIQANTIPSTWTTEECSTKSAYICEYPSGEHLDYAQSYLAGTSDMAMEYHEVTELAQSSYETLQNGGTNSSAHLIMPGFWYQQPGHIQTYKFQLQNIPDGGISLCFLLYRPICDSNTFLVQPGCEYLPSPYAGCAMKEVNCPKVTDCQPGTQYCYLSNKCLTLSEPCTCANGDPVVNASCNNPINSPNYPYHPNATSPVYSIVEKTCVYAPQPAQDPPSGKFIVDAGNIEVQPTDIIGVFFMNGTLDVLCEPSSQAKSRTELLQVNADKMLGEVRVDVDGEGWVADQVCNIQVVYTRSAKAVPPPNIKHRSSHTDGEYTYEVTVFPFSSPPFQLERKVIMQFRIAGLTLVYPDTKCPSKSSKALVVEPQQSIPLLWHISKGTDVSLQTTVSGGTKEFSSLCPDSVDPTLCKKNYQLHSETIDSGDPGNIITATIDTSNEISQSSWTNDIYTQERISNLQFKNLDIVEFVSPQQVDFEVTINTGSDVNYEFTCGNTVKAGPQGRTSCTFTTAGDKVVTCEACNCLSCQKDQLEIRLVQRAKVDRIDLTVPAEVETNKEFSFNAKVDKQPYSLVTLYIDLGDGNPEITDCDYTSSSCQRTIKHTYDTDGEYKVMAITVDQLFSTDRTNIPALVGHEDVVQNTQYVTAWTIINGLAITALTPTPPFTMSDCQPYNKDLNCQPTNNELDYTVSFPDGYSNTAGYQYVWDFGGEIDDSSGVTTSHTYDTPGSHTIKFDVQSQGDRKIRGSASYSQCIETAVSGLTLGLKSQSPYLALRKGSSVSTSFNVGWEEGSDLHYMWTYGGKTSCENPTNFEAEYNTYGTEILTLDISNYISQATKGITLFITEIIENVAVKCTSCTDESEIYLTVDEVGVFEISTTAGSDITSTIQVEGPGTVQETDIDTQYNVSWSSPGEYVITAMTSNPVSSGKATATVIVQEQISGLRATAAETTKVNQPVLIQASNDQGIPQTFQWEVCFYGTCTIEAETTENSWTYNPTQSGTYEIHIIAMNKVSSDRTSIIFEAWDLITKVSTSSPSLTMLWGVKGDDLTFIATVDPEPGPSQYLTYNWVLMDSYTSLVLKNITTYSGNSTFNIDEEGRYELQVWVRNPYSEAKETFIFNTQEAIDGQQILALDGDIANEDEFLHFLVTYDKGSLVMHRWSVETTSGTPPVLPKSTSNTLFGPIQFKEGLYKIKVQLKNKVTNIDVEQNVKIQVINGAYSIVLLTLTDPFVHQDDNIKMEPRGINLPSQDEEYQWRLFDTFPEYPPTTYTGRSPSHNFTKLGNFVLELRFIDIVVRKIVTVQVKLPPAVLSPTNAVLSTGQSLTFQTAFPSGNIQDLQYQWKIGDAELIKTLVGTLTIDFPNAGKFSVQVIPSNQVSFTETHVTVTVQDPVDKPEIMNCCFYNISEEYMLMGHVSAGTDVFFEWQVEFANSVINLSGNEVPVKFPSVGSYMVTLTASNLVSTVVDFFEVFAVEPIRDLRLTGPRQVHNQHQLATFRVTHTQGTNITYQWKLCFMVSLSINCTKEETTEPYYEHVFTHSGNFILQVLASNNASSDSVRFALTSFNIRCKPMILSHIGGESHSSTASRGITLEAKVSVNCTRYPLVYSWKIFSDSNLENEVLLDGLITGSRQLSLNRTSLSKITPGKYTVRYQVEYAETPLSAKIDFYLLISHSLLLPIIDGGSEIYRSSSQELILDGGRSNDPDTESGDLTGIGFSWQIKDQNSDNVELAGIGMDEKRITIPAGKLEANVYYTISLTISKAGRETATVSQKIFISSANIPSVGANVAASLDYPGTPEIVSVNRVIKLSGSCKRCKNPVYKWQASDVNGNEIDLGNSLSGDDQVNLILPAGFLDHKVVHTLKLSVWDSGNFEAEGISTVILQPNQPPTGGLCTVEGPDTVRAMKDKVMVRCDDNWYDPDGNSPLEYEILLTKLNAQTSADKYRVYKGQGKENSFMAVGLDAAEGKVGVEVYVSDEKGGRTLAVKVEIMVIVEIPPGMSMADYLLQSIQIDLSQIVLQKNARELLQYCTAVSIMLIHGEKAGNITQGDQEKLVLIKFILINSLEEVPFSGSQDELTDLAFTFRMLLSGDVPMSIEALRKVEKFLVKASIAFEATASSEYSIEDRVPENLFSITFSASKHYRMNLEQENASSRRKRSTGLTELPHIPQRLATSSSKYLILSQPAFTFCETEMCVFADKVDPWTQSEFNYKDSEFCFSVPASALTSGERSDEGLGRTVTTQPESLLSSDPNITSKVISVKFHQPDGKETTVEDLDKDQLIQICMPTKEDEMESLMPEATNKSRIFKPQETFMLHFDTNASFLADACGLNLAINCERAVVENATEHETKGNMSVKACLAVDREPQWYNCDEELEIMCDPRSKPDLSHKAFTLFTLLCLDEGKDRPRTVNLALTNQDGRHSANVSVSPSAVTCQYYDVGLGSWSSRGCQPTADSNMTHTVCLVNHLTLFGGSALVSPDDIDFSDLTALDLADNPVVVILVSVIAGIFIVVVFWARQSDLQDLHNISVVPLCGRDGMYKFEVIVITGRKRGAGTSAHVGLKLYGNEGKSGARHLTRVGAFQRNCEDSFLVATDRPLGPIQKIHLWHDNTGKHPSWYVNRVVVRDLQTNAKYFFLVDSWLSLTVEKASLDKQIFVASQAELSNFGTVFSSETSRGFAERHVWLSVWDRPPRSRFTRVQRVVCCATLLYSFMCANVMWYGLINQPEREAQALGLVKIGWQDFVIGILASIVVFPINFVIIQIFRLSKVKINATDYGIKPGTAQTIEVEAICDISQSGDSFIVYGNRKNSLRLRRQGSSDSIMVKNRLRRTGPETSGYTRRRICPSSASSSISTRSDATSSGHSKRQIPIEGRNWWSNDTILKWPENMPNDQRPDSSLGQAGPLRKRPAYRKALHSTGSYDELILDDDVCSAADYQRILGENNNRRIVRKTTSQTLSINESIAEVDEDEYLEKGSNVIPMPEIKPERTDSWDTTASHFTLKKDIDTQNNNPRTDPKIDSDSGEVNQALMEIDNHINDGDQIEPRLMNKKKFSGRQGTTPTNNADILRLDELEPEGSREDEPKSTLRKTRSKSRLSRRWAQIVIPPEYEQYKNDSYQVFDPEEDYDAMSIARSSLRKSRGNSLSSVTTNSSRFHQLMPANLSTRTRCLLPHWCIYIAYFLCLVITFFSIIITILYGHVFGKDLALKWLLAFFISFLDSVFILEPLKVLALAVIFAMVTGGLQDEDEGIETRPLVEANEKLKDVRMKPMGGFALLQAREEGKKVQRMHRMLRHFGVYFFFLWICFFITYRAHNTSMYPVNQDVQNSFLIPKSINGTSFHNIQRSEEVWSWLKEVALPAVYQEQNMGTNTQRILLGEARLRQIRGRLVECRMSGLLTKVKADFALSHGCYGDPDWHEETGNYDIGWQDVSNGTVGWSYSPPSQALGEDYQGKVSSYPGGGYVQGLGSTLREAQDTLDSLMENHWTDRSTQAVFLEATLYTLPSYLHTTVRILLEFPTSGGVFMSQDVQSIMLVNHVPGQVTALMIFIALLSLILVYMVVDTILSIRRHSYHYFFSFWSWIHVTITILVFLVIVFYIHSTVVDTAAYTRYTKDPKAFNSFFYSVSCYQTWKACTGILVFLATAWLVRLMRFVKQLSSYGKTISSASWQLFAATVFLLIFIFAFTHLGHLWFGSVLGVFRTTGSSFLAVFSLIPGQASSVLGAMYETSPVMTGFFTCFFIATVLIIMMGLFMAILNSTYKTIRLQATYHNTLDMQDHEMIDFMMKRFKKYIGITKPKPAFRRVKFQGMPSISSRSSMSSRMGMTHSLVSSGSYDAYGFDALEERNYLEELLDRCVPTWNRMLEKLEYVLWLDREMSRLEKFVMEKIGSTLALRSLVKLRHLEGLNKAAKVVEKPVGKSGSRCHRSNSESLMTDVRAKQIRDALNADLMELEKTTLTGLGTPSRPRKTLSFTEGHSGTDKSIHPARQNNIHKWSKAGDDLEAAMSAAGIKEKRKERGGTTDTYTSVTEPRVKPVSARPPLQPKRFLNSATTKRPDPKQTPEARATDTKSGFRRRDSIASSISSSKSKEPSTAEAKAKEATKDAPKEAQKAYGPKLPRKGVSLAGLNLGRKPTGEQSERVKRNPSRPPNKDDR